MLVYLQILIFFSFTGLTVVRLYRFLSHNTQSKKLSLMIHFWVALVYTFFISFYYLKNKIQIFQSPNENFMILGWLMTLFSFVDEWNTEKNFGFLLTPLVSFISLLGIIAVTHPKIITLNDPAVSSPILKMENTGILLSLLGDVFYFYAIILSIISYRLYLELKYHLPLFFSSRLPSIAQTDRSINRYLIWGNLFLLASSVVFLVSYFRFFSTHPSIPSRQLDFLFLQKIILLGLILFFFTIVQTLRWKKYITIKLNLILMVCGAFLLLFHLFYL